MKISRNELEDAFSDGMENARIRSYGDGLLRSIQVSAGIVAALLSPVVWWGKVLIFVGVMFVIGVVVQYRILRRNRGR